MKLCLKAQDIKYLNKVAWQPPPCWWVGGTCLPCPSWYTFLQAELCCNIYVEVRGHLGGIYSLLPTPQVARLISKCLYSQSNLLRPSSTFHESINPVAVGPYPNDSLNLNCLLEGSVSKYSHCGICGFNTGIWERYNSDHNKEWTLLTENVILRQS